MKTVGPGTAAADIVARARALILRPLATWEEIQAEEVSIEQLYRRWVAPLAAIPPVCHAAGVIAFGGYQLFGVHYRLGIAGELARAAASYALTLAGVFLTALAVDALALRFGGERGRTQAFKLAAYSSTPVWLAGVFMLLPSLGVLAVLGALYGLYLMYLGLPVLMRSDPEQTLTYFAVTLVAMIGIAVLGGLLTSRVGGWGGPIAIY
jgi:hypothetical protein